MESRRARNITIALASVYGSILIWINLLKTSTISEIPYLRCERCIHLIPFQYLLESKADWFEAVANLIVFIPFGIYLGMLNVKAWKTILYGFALSLLFEIAQYLFAIGVADVTDLITNTAGAAIGGFLYLLLKRLVRNKEKLNRVLQILAGIGTLLFIVFATILLIAN